MRQKLRAFFLSLTYARRELRAGIRGFYIFLACLALGVAAIAGVQSLSAGMMDSLRHDGRSILGGDMALRTIYQPATPDQLRFLRHKMGVTTVVMETRAMARTADENRVSLVELKAIDPFYPLYGKVEFSDENGNVLDAKPQDMVLTSWDEAGNETKPWGVAVDKEILTRLGLHVGDMLRIGTQEFQIRGIITREPDRISSQRFSFAPRVMISLYTFDKTGLQEQGNQVYYDHRVHLPYVRTPADMQAAMDKVADAFPDAQWKGRTWYNASPRLERMINRLTQFLTLIGLTTLLVGGVGVSNAVRGFLDGKLANIATFKCLGASGAFVTRVYMTVILMLAALGIAAGLALGAAAALGAGHLLTARLSLTNLVGISPGALGLAAGFGLLTAICFSLWPIARAAGVAPRELFRDMVAGSAKRPPLNIILWTAILAQMLALLAIATSSDQQLAVWFILGAAAVFAIFLLYAAAIKAVLKRIALPAWPELRMALSNLHRPGNVSSSVILSLGLGLTVLVAVALVQNNFSSLLARDITPDTPSFFFLDVQPDQREAFAQTVTGMPTARSLVMATSFRGNISAVNGKPAQEALVDANEAWVIRSDRGFTVAKTLPPNSDIVEGAWWPENYAGPPAVSIATNVAQAFDIGVGDKLTLNIFGAEVEAEVLNVRDVNWSSFSMNFAVTFAPSPLFSKIPANAIATVIIEKEHEEAMQLAVAKSFPNVTVVRVRDALEAAQGIIRAVAQAAGISAGVTLIAGALVLAGGVAAARRRHVYDAVILKVLGATRARILKTFLLEYGLLGLLTVLIAGLLGTGAAWAVLTYVMDISWRFSPLALLAVTSLSLAITLAAGFAGTWRALLQKPAAMLRNQ